MPEPPAIDVPEADLASIPAKTLLEMGFPHAEVSRLVAADRRSRDWAYRAHRWFARRPAALLRSLLLAAVLPGESSPDELWHAYRETKPWLDGLTVHDPFLGGGTTVIEASRLGAACIGGDVDPLAVLIGQHASDPPMSQQFDVARGELISHLKGKVGHLYPSSGENISLHTFSVALVTCPHCDERSPLYRNPVISRGTKKDGSVARPLGVTVFCPDCFDVHELPLSESVLDCCGKRWPLGEGTFSQAVFRCPHCGGRSSHRDLATGVAPRVLVGVEETSQAGRRFRRADHREEAIKEAAKAYLEKHEGDLALPSTTILLERNDQRPITFGIKRYRELFSDRQLALFGTAFQWISNQELEPRTARALRLAMSNALATNNKLCGYAHEYGRLAALFSVRGYSLPALAVELNALHPSSGRGTVPRVMERISASLNKDARRYVFNKDQQLFEGKELEVKLVTLQFPATPRVTLEVVAADANSSGVDERVDLVITDPPYYDYIAYDELSAFYRAWLPNHDLVSEPLHPPTTGDRPKEFGIRLGKAFANAVKKLKRGGLIAFTYHSSNPEAWLALGYALDEAKLGVTGLWPVLTDPHMGHHGTQGACEYDLVVVARPQESRPQAVAARESARAWADAQHLDPDTSLQLGKADRLNLKLAYETCATRWSVPPPRSNQGK